VAVTCWYSCGGRGVAGIGPKGAVAGVAVGPFRVPTAVDCWGPMIVEVVVVLWPGAVLMGKARERE